MNVIYQTSGPAFTLAAPVPPDWPPVALPDGTVCAATAVEVSPGHWELRIALPVAHHSPPPPPDPIGP